MSSRDYDRSEPTSFSESPQGNGRKSHLHSKGLQRNWRHGFNRDTFCRLHNMAPIFIH